MNASNAVTDPQYYNHYQNALNYVSPEVASKLRALNDEGDAYDQEVSKNRGESYNRSVGIREFKNAVASGALKADGYDKWMKDHNLSKQEMQELVNDPEAQKAMSAAGVIADNGRVNSQAAQARRFQNEVADAENKAGVGIINSLTPASELMWGTVKDIRDWASGERSYKFGDWTSNRLNNTILSGYSGGAPTYFTDVTGSTGNGFVDTVLDTAFAPETYLGFATKGSGMRYRTRTKPTYWKKTVRPKKSRTIRYDTGYIEANPFNNDVGNFTKTGEKTITTRPTKGHKKGQLRSPGYTRYVYWDAPDAALIPAIHGENLQYPTYQPITTPVPEFDRGVTYGPYIGTNNYSFKHGGKITQYIKD